jgi:hypothetical protein
MGWAFWSFILSVLVQAACGRKPRADLATATGVFAEVNHLAAVACLGSMGVRDPDASTACGCAAGGHIDRPPLDERALAPASQLSRQAFAARRSPGSGADRERFVRRLPAAARHPHHGDRYSLRRIDRSSTPSAFLESVE